MELAAYSIAMSRSVLFIEKIIKKTPFFTEKKAILIEIGIVVGLLLVGGIVEYEMIKSAEKLQTSSFSSYSANQCELEPDPGLCKAYFPKYYFDKETQACQEFIYGGCGGVVPFDTIDECTQQCSKKPWTNYKAPTISFRVWNAYHAEFGSFHRMVETNVLNVDQKNHMTLKAVMVHVAAVIATKSIF